MRASVLYLSRVLNVLPKLVIFPACISCKLYSCSIGRNRSCCLFYCELLVVHDARMSSCRRGLPIERVAVPCCSNAALSAGSSGSSGSCLRVLSSSSWDGVQRSLCSFDNVPIGIFSKVLISFTSCGCVSDWQRSEVALLVGQTSEHSVRQACSHYAIPEPPGLVVSTDVRYCCHGLVILLEFVVDVTHTCLELLCWCWLSCFVFIILVELAVPETMLVTETSSGRDPIIFSCNNRQSWGACLSQSNAIFYCICWC